MRKSEVSWLLVIAAALPLAANSQSLPVGTYFFTVNSVGGNCDWLNAPGTIGSLTYPGIGNLGTAIQLDNANNGIESVVLSGFPVVPPKGLNGWTGGAPANVKVETYSFTNVTMKIKNESVRFDLINVGKYGAQGSIKFNGTDCNGVFSTALFRTGLVH